MALSIGLETARTAFVDSVHGFVGAVEACDDWALLASSRCHGWTRVDVALHVLAGWQEMLGGFVSPADGPPTVDAATYWPAFDDQAAEDPLVPLLAQRRRTAAYTRLDSARRHLHDVAGAVLAGAAGLGDGHVSWQGHVFTAGDFLAIWAVEDALHQLDLLTDRPVPGTALDLARATVAELDGRALDGRLPDG